MGKRGNGEGCATYNSERCYWEARFSFEDSITGEIKRRKFTGEKGAKQSEVLMKGRKWLLEMENGLLSDAGKVTLGHWMTSWLADYIKPKAKPKTLEKYQSQVDLYINPSIGQKLLGKVTAPDLQRLYNRLMTEGGKAHKVINNEGKEVTVRKGLSAYTVRNVHVCLHAAFGQAIKVGLLTRNVTEATEPPRLTRYEVKPMDLDQAQMLLVEAAKVNPRTYIITLLALETGMRKGEVFGLKWQDIDMKKGLLSVRRSLATTAKKTYLQEPKTAKSRRTISLTSGLVKALKSYKAKQAEQKLAMGELYEDQDFVVANELGGIVHPNTFHATYRRMLKRTGLEEFNFHTLRHTHASMLLHKGINAKVVQERLGHASMTMTLDVYSHLMPGMQETVVIAMDGVLCQ